MNKKIKKIPLKKFNISALIVTFNEERYLKRCLKSLYFCDDIVVIDLGSKDNSIKIASKFTDNIHVVPRLLFVESIREKYYSYVKNNWLICIDPDEYLDKELVLNIEELIKNDEISTISVPWRFYYKNRILKGTLWSRRQYKEIIFNLKHIKFKSSIIRPIIISKGKREKIRSRFFLNHTWFESPAQLKEKIERYAEIEGEEKFSKGIKYSFTSKLLKTIFWFLINFFYYRGFIDGKLGLFLSVYYSKYIWDIDNRLRDLSLKKN